jgi:RHS repeat-associated protein
VQVVQPNGGETLYLGDPNTITWNSTGQTGMTKLELLINNAVAGTIAENLPATQTSYQWQVGKTLAGSGTTGTNFKVRVSSIVPSIATTSYYFYDSSGRLLAEYDGNGTCVKDYIYNGSKLLAEYQPSGSKYYYYTSDQINSTRIITDSAGSVIYSTVFDPYGGMQKQWVNTYSPALKFSGKERESNTELDYFGARYYDHLKYRFISVDPVINKDEALANPQLWNLYSYCRNNPVTYNDPDGRWAKEVHDKIIDTAFPGDKNSNMRNILKEASAYVDSNQSLKYSYKHAMKAPWENQKQAEVAMNNFLNYMSRKYEEFVGKGREDKAYFALGMAMHALMDSTSPLHEGFQTWGNMEIFDSAQNVLGTIEFLVKGVPHLFEKSISSERMEKSVGLIQNYLKENQK